MSKIPTIYDEFECKGSWWVAGQEDNKVSGVLKYSKMGIVLELFDSFTYTDFFDNDRSIEKHSVILGDCFDGLVTLLDCVRINKQLRFSPSSGKTNAHITFRIDLLIKGIHYNSVEEILLPNAQVHFSNLEMWLRHHPFEKTFEPSSIKLTEIKTFEAYIANIQLKISSAYSVKSNSEMYESEGFAYKPYISFVTDTKHDIEWFRKTIWKFRNFLCVLTDSDVYIESIECELSFEHTIRIYTTPVSSYEHTKLERFHVFMIGLEEIRENINAILTDWYNNKIDQSIYIYIDNIIKKSKVLEDKFIAYVKAIESAHRENESITTKFMEDDLYKVTINKMLDVAKLDNFPNDLLNKLRDNLKYANEFGFQRRVKDVLKDIPDEIKEFVLLGHRVQDFADIIRINRDYYTHFGDFPERLFTTSQLLYINKSLKIITVRLILNEIGILDDILIKALQYEYYLLTNLKQGSSLFNQELK